MRSDKYYIFRTVGTNVLKKGSEEMFGYLSDDELAKKIRAEGRFLLTDEEAAVRNKRDQLYFNVQLFAMAVPLTVAGIIGGCLLTKALLSWLIPLLQ